MTEAATPPRWTEGLTRKGEYYEGIVADAERYLQLHAASTITTYGTRTSWKLDLPFNSTQEISETNTLDRTKVCVNAIKATTMRLLVSHQPPA